MIENIIARAHKREHPSRYAIESGLGKVLALIALLAFPFLCFADVFPSGMLYNIYTYRYNSTGSFSVPAVADRPQNVPIDSLPEYFFNNSFGVKISNVGTVLYPASDVLHGTSLTNSVKSEFCFIQGTNGVWYSTVKICPDILTYATLCSRLFVMGYDGSGFLSVYTNSNNQITFNVNPSRVFVDVINGTNTVWRRVLFESLSSIGQSVVNIDTGVSELRPVLSDIKDINASISSNSVEQSLLLRNISTNSSLSVSGLLDVVSGLGTLHDDNLANSIDSFLGDDTDAWCGFVDWAVQNGYLLEVYGLEYQNAMRATDPRRKGRSYSIPDSHRRFFVKNQIKHSVVEAVKMRGKYQSLMTAIVNGNTGAISSIGGTFNADVISGINNGNIAREDWRSELRQQLQDWKHSDETGILNVVDKVNKAVDSINRNLETQFPNSTNTQSFTQFVTNYVTRVITNSIERTGDNISSNVQDSAKQTRDLLNDTLFNPDYEGVNVRIKFPLRYQHTDEVNVHDESVYNAMMDFINSRAFDMTNLFAHIDSLASNFPTNEFSWIDWFDRWDPFATNVNWFISRYQDSDTTPIVLDPFENGFSEEEYHNLPWFSRVEALLFHIAQIGTNSITSVTEDDMRSLEDSRQEFDNIGTNFVAASVRVVRLFDGIRDFADSMARSFGNLAAKSTNGVVILPAGSWIGEDPLVLRVDTRVQDVCRIVSSCIWYLLAIMLCWSVVSATWSKVCSFVRWLWSVMDI